MLTGMVNIGDLSKFLLLEVYYNYVLDGPGD
jgi:hypothetical protein